ncbi:MAG: dihydroorotase [Gammaproteobacteria bacterium]|nr:MAG: dihydroorotase [Gammaproteobacteria bacterium]
MKNSLSLDRPDDWHVHLRDGPMLKTVLAHTAARFARAIVMPNLVPPVTSAELAGDYRDRILQALPKSSARGAQFEPLMTLFLTDETTPDQITAASATGFVPACKLYPAGATTHSDSGVTAIENIHPALEAMQDQGVVLLLHGEVTDPAVDAFDRETEFIRRVLMPLVEQFPRLRIVLEHITTRDAVEFIRAAPDNVAATITAHHLLLNRNAMFAGGFQPHHYCLPLIKREKHRLAVLDAATSGHPRFFLGTDSAPHTRTAKESSCGCAGIYTAHAGLELYAGAFEQAGALDRLEAFASHFGPDFYGLPRNTDKITLERKPWTVPESIPVNGEELVPLCAGGELAWRLADQ